MRNLLRSRSVRMGLCLVVIFALVLPVAYSHFFNGNNRPIIAKNNDNNSTYSANLMAYGDTNDSLCNDSDNGFKPDRNGSMTWFDPYDNNSYNRMDFCDSNFTLVEYGCSKNFKINNNQYNNRVIAARVDCNANGFTFCNANLRRCV